MSQRKMFFDGMLESEFRSKGYVKLRLVPDEQLADLKAFYQDQIEGRDILMEGRDDKKYTIFSVFHMKPEYRQRIFEKVRSTLEPVLANVLSGYRSLVGNYVIKYPGKGILDIHQNAQLVNEAEFTSLSVWCPLQPTNEKNGTLHFIDGSHKMFRGNRSPMTHRPFLGIQKYLINNHMTKVDVELGEVIILDDSVIHYSDINRSGDARISAHLIMIPDEARPLFVEDADREASKLNLYEVHEKYFQDISVIHGKDKGEFRKIGVVDNEIPVFNRKTFLSRYDPARSKKTLFPRFRTRIN